MAKLSGDEKARTIASIEEMLEAYKKQLLEQMQAAKELEDEKQAQKNFPKKVAKKFGGKKISPYLCTIETKPNK